MDTLDVRIVSLKPMRVAAVHGFGPNPEELAIGRLVAWAGPKGLLEDREKHRIFGFDNPSPSPGSPNYGYELWIVVGPDAAPEEGMDIRDFPGGMYAVTRCQAVENITHTWMQLVQWLEKSQYGLAHRVCLEEFLSPVDGPLDELVLDLCLAIEG